MMSTIKKQSILDFMPVHAREQLIALGAYAELKEGKTLFLRGDTCSNFYIVLSGNVIISVNSDEGREIVLNKLGAGDVFGEIAMFDKSERTTDAYATPGTKLVSIDRERFLAFFEENPALYKNIITFLCGRLRALSGHVDNFALSNSHERLVSKLVTMAKIQGGGKSALIETSQSDLAKMLGLSREIVNKNLQQLRAKNLLELKRNKICIPDVEKLDQLQRKGAA